MSKYQKIFVKNQKGEWVENEVKKGFANYLLNKEEGALLYSKENVQKVKKLNEKNHKQKTLERENAQKLCNQLNNLQIIFKLSKKNEKIFGSIRIEDIMKELSKQEIYLEKKQFLSFSPLSSLGEHRISIKLGEWNDQPIKAQLRITVSEK